MRSRKRIVAFVLVMLFFFPTLPTIVSASPDGESWLVGWSYRKSHVINSAFGAGTNYQVNIVVHYGSGTDSGFDIFCGGKCKPDFGDVRFTDNDGITLLDYWMEKKTDSDKATFWVEIADDLSTSDVTIYIYYGNPAASTTSDGDATFILFDSYDDNSLDASKWNWQLDNNNASSVHLAEQNQRMESWKDVGSGVSGANYRESDDSWALERIVEFELYVDYDRTSIGGYAHQWLVWYQDDNNKLMCTHGSYNSTHFRIILESVEGGSHNPGEWGYFSWDTWYYVRTRIDPTSIVLEVFSGGFDETIEHVTYLSHTRTGYGRFHNRICSSSSATDGFRYFDDDFRVRKYTYPEPSHGSWGTEESNWLTGWSHRKSHTINPASGAGTDYQIRITVNFGAGTDNGENAYCDSQCRADFGDIRFTDDDGVTELDYWMEEKVDFNYGVFWVEIRDDLSTSSATIFMYYGNSTATTISNGPNTFLVFDDFEDGDTTGWSLDDAVFTASTDYSYSGSFSGKLEKATGGNGIYFAYQNVSLENYCICAWAYEDARGDNWDNYGVGGRYIDSDNYYYGCMINPQPTPDLRIRKRSVGVGSELATKAWTQNEMYGIWSRFEFGIYGTQLRLWIDGTEELTATDGGNSVGEPILASWMGDSFDVHLCYGALISGLVVGTKMKNAGVGTVYDVADDVPAMIGMSPQIPGAFRPFGVGLARLLLRCNLAVAERVTLTTDALDLPRSVSDKYVVLPNGVDTDLFRKHDSSGLRKELGFGGDTFVLGYVGVLREWVDLEPAFAA
ncbi:MAG: DUF2341 domain-containing protein, partial [Promethearchaeota archaeon]